MFHLTAKNVVGQRFSKEIFDGAKIALLGFCPYPNVLDDYYQKKLSDQAFIHVSPDSVRLITSGTHKIVALHHIYGGPVASAVVEELAYYGIEYILAYGLAGSLGEKKCDIGDFYIIEDALAADGTTKHYTKNDIVLSDDGLSQNIQKWWVQKKEKHLIPVRAATGDAIYRENDDLLRTFRQHGCHIVNLDSAHLYAVAKINGEEKTIKTIQCGVISDSVSEEIEESKTSLGVMLNSSNAPTFNPMDNVNDIVHFYLETVVPRIM